MDSSSQVESTNDTDNSQVKLLARSKIPWHLRMRTRLLLFIALSVFVTEVLVFVPSIANMRQSWLQQRHQAAEAISLILYSDKTRPINDDLQSDILAATDALVISIVKGGEHVDLAVNKRPQKIDKIIDLQDFSETKALLDSFETLFFGGNKTLMIVGPIAGTDMQLQITISDAYLKSAMQLFTWHFILISLTIAIVAATLIYLIVHELLVRPLRDVYTNMLDFVMEPDNPSHIMIPEARRDEVGDTQRRIAAVETELQRSYIRQKHLANLGLAVSKINHDMRNILASAQLMVDHLATAKDPMVKKLAPKLIRAIDRAVNYSQSVITYGRTQETPPKREKLALKLLIEDVHESLAIKGADEVEFQNFVPENIEVDADNEQLHRVITNLCRNAIQAMLERPDSSDYVIKRLTIRAGRMGTSTIIDIEDTGPGLPAKAKEHLFSPFQGSTSRNGSGLGLAICEELVRAHGGTIKLLEDGKPGTHFEIRIPDMPTSITQWAKNKRSQSA